MLPTPGQEWSITSASPRHGARAAMRARKPYPGSSCDLHPDNQDTTIMKRRLTGRTLFPMTLVAAAIAVASPSAYAQESASCSRLLTLVDESGGEPLRDEFSDAREVAERDEADTCSQYVTRIESAGGIVAADAAAQTIESDSAETETVQVESEATIEGEVQVTLPDPDVTVEQEPADIAVNTSPPDVTVSQGQPQITVRQAQPVIRVTMAQPTISIEQPAPEIIVTMPEPGVDVATTQPTVEVNIPEPRVTVTQGDPQLAVNLDAEVGESAEGSSNTTIERSDDNGTMTVTADGLSGGASEPQVRFVETEEQPNITYEGAEPTVNYESAEPDVQIESEGEPTIELVESGEPKIMIRQPGEEGGDNQQAALATEEEESSSNAAGEQRDPQQAFAAAEGASQSLEGASTGVVKVDELAGMPVVNSREEELGEVSRVVRNGNDTYMIVEHGGWFFGLNDKEIALPLADVTMSGENVVLRGLTEEQIESMPEYDYDSEVALDAGDEVTVQRLN